MPAPGKYLGSLRRRPGAAAAAALVEVSTSDAGGYRLTVHGEGADLGRGRPAGLAYVTFDERG